MAISVFVDTNIYLDVMLHRGKEHAEAEALLLLAEDGNINMYTSSSALLNLLFILRSFKISKQEATEHLHGILSYTTLTNPTNSVFEMALTSGFTDIEDALQYYTALQVKGMDYFITANLKDFKKASKILPVLSAKQFLQQYKS